MLNNEKTHTKVLHNQVFTESLKIVYPYPLWFSMTGNIISEFAERVAFINLKRCIHLIEKDHSKCNFLRLGKSKNACDSLNYSTENSYMYIFIIDILFV